MLTDDLLELQRIDTVTDQLTYRRANLPERAQSTAVDAELQDNRRRRATHAERNDDLEVAVGALERDGDTLATQRTRLEAQLKTVVAPRAAEALLHELETITHRRDALDDQELAYLEEQSGVADEMASLDQRRPELEKRADAAHVALAAAEADIDGELATLAAARSELVGRIDNGVVERYERLRARLGGVAVARLEGTRCGGCHLDLSTAELDEVRAVPDGQFANCPHCGRLLVP